MSEKAEAILIITAGVHTNRSYVARSFANHLTELGVEVDLSHVGHDDIDHAGVVMDKEEEFESGEHSRFTLSEHYVGIPIQLEPTVSKPQPLVRPAVPTLLDRQETGVAVLGGPNIGKSTLLHMFGDFLKSNHVDEERIKYAMIGEDYFSEWSTEELMHNLRKIKTSTKVVIYTRRSYTAEPLQLVLSSTDGYKAEQAAE